MAKGDHQRVQNATDYQGGLSQNLLNNLREDLKRQNQGLEVRAANAADQGNRDYSNIMGGYQSLFGKPASATNFGAYGGYQDFANTGGYSDSDKAALRERAVSPIRSLYDRGEQELERNRSLQGGYSPNFAASLAKMNRDRSHSIGDTMVSAEASLADAIRQGKLAGLGGMTGIDNSRMSESLANRSADMSALSGMNSLYGQTPGMASMYGNQLANSNQNLVQTQGMQQNLMQQIMQSLLGMSNVPGNYQSALGNIGSTLGLAGQVGGVLGGIPGLK